MRRKNTTSAMMCDYLAQALLILLKDHEFDQITISQLTEKAGVNRSTYYRHFASKQQLAQYCRWRLQNVQKWHEKTALKVAEGMHKQ